MAMKYASWAVSPLNPTTMVRYDTNIEDGAVRSEKINKLIESTLQAIDFFPTVNLLQTHKTTEETKKANSYASTDNPVLSTYSSVPYAFA